MEMWMIGFLVGILATVLIAVLAFVASKNKEKVKDTYDERQIRARGEAYKLGFIVALFGFLLLLILEFFATDKKLNINYIIPVAVVALVSMTVFGCACIWKDAWLMMYQKPKRSVLSVLLICIINYALGINNYFNYRSLIEQDIKILDEAAMQNMINGLPYESTPYEPFAVQFYMPWINIMCATVMLILIINYLVKLSVDKSREKRELDEES